MEFKKVQDDDNFLWSFSYTSFVQQKARRELSYSG